jgi:transposase
MSKVLHDFGITCKKLSVYFYEQSSEANVQAARKFCDNHSYHQPKISLKECSNTDKSGFHNNLKQTHGWGQIKKTKKINKKSSPKCKTAGGSHNDTSSKVHRTNVKILSKLINLVAIICLDLAQPVIGFAFEDQNVNALTFSHYIDNIRFSEMVNYDLIDRAFIHRAVSNDKINCISIMEIYKNKGVTPDFIPTGYPKFNPIEQLFGWLKQYLRKHASRFVGNNKWTKEKMIQALFEAKKEVSHKMVKGWYKNSYSHIHPDQVIPAYLRRVV